MIRAAILSLLLAGCAIEPLPLLWHSGALECGPMASAFDTFRAGKRPASVTECR